MNGMLYVYNTMPGKLLNEWRSTLIFWILVIMMAGLFLSRAVLSIAMIALVIVSLLQQDISGQIRKFIGSPLLIGMSALFLLPLLSGAWSDDQEQWLDIMRIKLPLLVLPLAFATSFGFAEKHWERLALFFILVMIVASGWCMLQYIYDSKAVHEAYLKAKTMITPLENDHVRFSWLVALAAGLSGWLAWQKRKAGGWLPISLAFVTAWLIIFLHILAARTGLFSFYIMLIFLSAWLVIRKTKWLQGALLLIILFVLPVLAYLVLPSFRNRVDYIRYDFSYLNKAEYLPGANDAVRVISLKTGWQTMQENPMKGVGFGDIKTEADRIYQKRYPGMLAEDKILPSSEWLLYGAGLGWTGFLLFTVIMIIPFFYKARFLLPWYALNATAAFSFLFDIGLEVQFGVFVYSIAILVGWKWMVTEKI